MREWVRDEAVSVEGMSKFMLASGSTRTECGIAHFPLNSASSVK